MIAPTIAVWLLAATVSAPRDAREGLAQARRATLDLELGMALELAAAALRTGTADPEQVRALYLLLAETSAAAGDRKAAADWFARLLELDANYKPPADAPPKIQGAFAEAAATLEGARLQASSRSAWVRPGELEVELRLSGDPLRLARGARVQLRGEDGWLSRALSERGDQLRGTWSCSPEDAAHYVSVLDEHGNELLRLGSRESPLVPERLRSPALAAAERVAPLVLHREAAPAPAAEPWYLRPTPYLAASGVMLAGALAAGLVFASDERAFDRLAGSPGEHFHAEVERLDSARRRDLAVMWTALGSAALFGALGGLTW